MRHFVNDRMLHPVRCIRNARQPTPRGWIIPVSRLLICYQRDNQGKKQNNAKCHKRKLHYSDPSPFVVQAQIALRLLLSLFTCLVVCHIPPFRDCRCLAEKGPWIKILLYSLKTL